MVTNGSSPPRRALPALLGPLVMVAGVLAMTAWAGLNRGRWPLSLALLTAELALILPGVLALVLFRIPLRRGLALDPLPAAGPALAIGAGACLWAVGLGVMQVQYGFWQPPPGYLDAFRRLHEALRPRGLVDEIVSVGAIAVAPGVCEEILFRGIVLPSLRRPLGSALAVVATALLFGLIHLDTGAQGGLVAYRVPFAVAVGLGLGALRVRSESLLAPMLAHATLNTVTFELARVLDTDTDDSPAPLLGALVLVAGGAGFAYLLRRLRPSTSLIDSAP